MLVTCGINYWKLSQRPMDIGDPLNGLKMFERNLNVCQSHSRLCLLLVLGSVGWCLIGTFTNPCCICLYLFVSFWFIVYMCSSWCFYDFIFFHLHPIIVLSITFWKGHPKNSKDNQRYPQISKTHSRVEHRRNTFLIVRNKQHFKDPNKF